MDADGETTADVLRERCWRIAAVVTVLAVVHALIALWAMAGRPGAGGDAAGASGSAQHGTAGRGPGGSGAHDSGTGRGTQGPKRGSVAAARGGTQPKQGTARTDLADAARPAAARNVAAAPVSRTAGNAPPLPALELGLVSPASPASSNAGASAGGGPSYFGEKIDRRRVCFVIDWSGSMHSAPFDPTNPAGRTRAERARQELLEVLSALDPSYQFNIVFFSQGVEPWESSLQVASPVARARARRFVLERHASGGTALHGALAFVFRDPSLDAVYLLSDGYPTDAQPAEILQSVARWNATRTRKITFFTFSFGERNRLLEDLAARTGGRYRAVVP